MPEEIILAFWSGAGLLWWLIAWRLVARDARRADKPADAAAAPLSLSIFKPLPPLDTRRLGSFAAGLESFVTQLDPDSELLLGIHEADRTVTEPFVAHLRAKHPQARLKVIFRNESDSVANPKIAWQKILARHADGELWLWSDSDIIAPAGFLARARAEFEQAGAAMVTFPYVVREIFAPPALFEALFVNVDFFPGVLLLRDRGPVDFGLGAGMLFRRDDFLQSIDWNEFGEMLADDFQLGQQLGSVHLSRATLATVPCATTWLDALAHDVRWARTIRWNRPGGSLARVAVLPVLGWLGAIAIHPACAWVWLGLFAMVQVDVLFACLLCRQVGCRLRAENLVALKLWSLWRVVLWIASWLPGGVSWSGRCWQGPRALSQFARNREANA